MGKVAPSHRVREEVFEACACDADPGGDALAAYQHHTARIRTGEAPLSRVEDHSREGDGSSSLEQNPEGIDAVDNFCRSFRT